MVTLLSLFLCTHCFSSARKEFFPTAEITLRKCGDGRSRCARRRLACARRALRQRLRRARQRFHAPRRHSGACVCGSLSRWWQNAKLADAVGEASLRFGCIDPTQRYPREVRLSCDELTLRLDLSAQMDYPLATIRAKCAMVYEVRWIPRAHDDRSHISARAPRTRDAFRCVGLSPDAAPRKRTATRRTRRTCSATSARARGTRTSTSWSAATTARPRRAAASAPGGARPSRSRRRTRTASRRPRATTTASSGTARTARRSALPT